MAGCLPSCLINIILCSSQVCSFFDFAVALPGIITTHAQVYYYLPT